MSGVISPTRADIVIVRRSGERHETVDIERWDVHTFGGELLEHNFTTREAAETAARRVAETRGVSLFYEHDPQRADSPLQLVATFGKEAS